MVFKVNGEVENLDAEMYSYLNCEIVGRSQLNDGTIYLVTRSIKTLLGTMQIYVMKFDIFGQARLVRAFDSIETKIYDCLNERVTAFF